MAAKKLTKYEISSLLITYIGVGFLAGFHYFYSFILDNEISQLKQELSRFNSSLAFWKQRPLTERAKHMIFDALDEELLKCDAPPLPFENIRMLHHMQKKHKKVNEDLYLETRVPSGHVVSSHSKLSRLPQGESPLQIWVHNKAGNSRLCNGIKLRKHRLKVEWKGLYYVYSQLKIKYNEESTPALHRHTTSRVIGDKTYKETLFENDYFLGNSSLKEGQHEKWGEQISHQSGLIYLYEGDSVEVGIRGPAKSQLKTKETESYFGLFLVFRGDLPS